MNSCSPKVSLVSVLFNVQHQWDWRGLCSGGELWAAFLPPTAELGKLLSGDKGCQCKPNQVTTYISNGVCWTAKSIARMEVPFSSLQEKFWWDVSDFKGHNDVQKALEIQRFSKSFYLFTFLNSCEVEELKICTSITSRDILFGLKIEIKKSSHIVFFICFMK